MGAKSFRSLINCLPEQATKRMPFAISLSMTVMYSEMCIRDRNQEVQKVVGEINVISGELDHIENYQTDVVDKIDGLTEISQNNAASTEETAATMDQLAEMCIRDSDKSPGSMSHLFVLVRMTAHITIRGRNKFATSPSVLCSCLLYTSSFYAG